MRQLLQLLFTSAGNATALMAMTRIVTGGSTTAPILLTTLIAPPLIVTVSVATGELVSTVVGLLLCLFVLCGLCWYCQW